MKGDIIKCISLYYDIPPSDKVYNVSVVEADRALYDVNFSYGRRGSALTTGRKNTTPVKIEAAVRMYETLIRSKTSKGYKIAGVTEPVELDLTKKLSPIFVPSEEEIATLEEILVLPQLLNEIHEKDVTKYLDDDNYILQEKHDGRRRMFEKSAKEIVALNKKGMAIPLEEKYKKLLENIPYEVVVDGEDMGKYVILFDLIVHHVHYIDRYKMLKDFFSQYIPHNHSLKLADCAFTKEEKYQMFKKLQTKGAEGVVFKKKDSIYTPGRPSSGGPLLKYKFTTSASCIVRSINTDKRSVSLGLFNDTFTLVDVGNATIYPNFDMPKVGDIVEIKYLYAYKNGCIYQPVYKGKRDDQVPADCNISQLKYKNENTDEEDEVFSADLEEIPTSTK